MSIRNVEGVVERVMRLAVADPSPDARAAYRAVLSMMSRVDSCDVGALQALFEQPRGAVADLCRCGLCVGVDVDRNPEPADWRLSSQDPEEDEELLRAQAPDVEPADGCESAEGARS